MIMNVLNNKRYIGSSICIEDRIKSHKKDLKSNKHFAKLLQEEWNKYGKEYFIFKLIEEVEDIEKLRAKEKEYVIKYNTTNSLYGYNKHVPNEFEINVGPKTDEEKEHLRKLAYIRMFGETSEEEYLVWKKHLFYKTREAYAQKEIIALDITSGEIIYIAKNNAEIAKALNLDVRKVQKAVKGWDPDKKKKVKSYHGYKFIYREDYESGNYTLDNGRTIKPVLQYDLGGNLLKEYSSVEEAAEYLEVPKGTLTSNLNGISKVCKKLKCIFKYKEAC